MFRPRALLKSVTVHCGIFVHYRYGFFHKPLDIQVSELQKAGNQ